MKKLLLGAVILAPLAVLAYTQSAPPECAPGQSKLASHCVWFADKLDWKPVLDPKGNPTGIEQANLEGDPNSKTPAPYTMRVRIPANMRLPEHWHPHVERATLLSGELTFVSWDKYDPTNPDSTALTVTLRTPGDFSAMPAGRIHKGRAGPGGAVIQVHGISPWKRCAPASKDPDCKTPS